MDWIDEWGKVIDDAQVSDLNPWVEGAVCPWENTGRKSGFTATFPDSSVGKESICNAGDLRSIPGLGRSPGEGKGYSLQYSGLENSSKVMSLIFNMLSRFLIAFLPREVGI